MQACWSVLIRAWLCLWDCVCYLCCYVLGWRSHFVLTHAWADSGAALLLGSPARPVFQADISNDYMECRQRFASVDCACWRVCVAVRKFMSIKISFALTSLFVLLGDYSHCCSNVILPVVANCIYSVCSLSKTGALTWPERHLTVRQALSWTGCSW